MFPSFRESVVNLVVCVKMSSLKTHLVLTHGPTFLMMMNLEERKYVIGILIYSVYAKPVLTSLSESIFLAERTKGAIRAQVKAKIRNLQNKFMVIINNLL